MKMDVIGQAKLQAFLGLLPLLIASLVWSGIRIDVQEVTRRNQVHLLPPLTGDALTLTPTDMPDISCSIVEWKDNSPLPTLAVICPPEEMFAPLHLYLKLSWLKAEDVPSSAHRIIAPAKAVIKIRTEKSIAWVWVGVREKPDAAPRQTWVGFNAVADVALKPTHV